MRASPSDDAAVRPSRATTTGSRTGIRRPILLIALLVLVLPPSATAQVASPLLSMDHWGRSVLVRLHSAGLTPVGFDPAASTLGRVDAVTMLEYAVETSAADSPGWLGTLDGALARLRTEFPGAVAIVSPGASSIVFEGSVSTGVRARENGILARHQQTVDGPRDTRALEDRTSPYARLDLAAYQAFGRPSLAVQLDMELLGTDIEIVRFYGTVGVGPMRFWAGRRPLAFGAGDAGSIVFSSSTAFEGAGLFLSEGVRLPGVLRSVGDVQFETFLSRLGWSGYVESPYVFGFRGSVAPHPRFRVGLNRGAFFGGESDRVPPVTLRRVLKVLAGVDTAEPGWDNFEDHVASLDFWFRPPLGDRWPLIVYAEWGVEDLETQRREMPGVVTGLRLGGWPGATGLSVGLERTSFGPPPGPGREWYNHRVFGTWTDAGRLLAHPLGGDGSEWRMFGAADALSSRLRIEVRFYFRDRGEANLFAPAWGGRSRGLGAAVRWQLTETLELQGRTSLEAGDAWHTATGRLGLRLHF